jgi:hypothetical protein
MKSWLGVFVLAVMIFPFVRAASVRAIAAQFPEIPRPQECTREILTKEQVFDWLQGHSIELWETPTAQREEFDSIPAGTPADPKTVGRLAATLRDWTACRNAAVAFADFSFGTDRFLVLRGWQKPSSDQEQQSLLDHLDEYQRKYAAAIGAGPDFSGANAIWDIFGARVLADGRIGVFVLWGQLGTANGKEEVRVDQTDFVIFVEENGQFYADDLISAGEGCPNVAINKRLPTGTDDIILCA